MTKINHLKPSYQYVPLTVTLKNSMFLPHGIFVCHVIVTIHRN